MLPSFPYLAMTITGVLHLIFGAAIFINAMVGFNTNIHVIGFDRNFVYRDFGVIRVYLGIVTGSSLWIMMVGILGILTGVKSMEHEKTNGLKIAYMVTAILSAVIFSLAGVSLSILVNSSLSSIGLVGSLCSIADFILSIVSSSICCCCASTRTNGVVVVHAPQPGTVMYPHPNAVHVQNYPIQTPDEGFANPGYQVNGPAIHSGVMPKQGMV